MFFTPVGLSGLEPLTPALSAQCSNLLSYRPFSGVLTPGLFTQRFASPPPNAHQSPLAAIAHPAHSVCTSILTSMQITPASQPQQPKPMPNGTLTAEEWKRQQPSLARLVCRRNSRPNQPLLAASALASPAHRLAAWMLHLLSLSPSACASWPQLLSSASLDSFSASQRCLCRSSFTARFRIHSCSRLRVCSRSCFNAQLLQPAVEVASVGQLLHYLRSYSPCPKLPLERR